MPAACPACRRNDAWRTTANRAPGGATVRFCASRTARGSGRAVRTGSGGVSRSRSPSDRQPTTARCSRGQYPTAWSIGASARPSRMDPAIMNPGVSSPRKASHAPSPSIIDCRNRRSVLVITP